MGTPESDQQTSVTRAQQEREGVSLGVLVVVVLALIPASVLLAAWALIVFTNNLDVAFALGVSDALLFGLLIAAGGLVAGLVAALVTADRGWRLLAPPAAGLLVGLGTYLAFAVFERGEWLDPDDLGFIATIWLGQAAAIVVATRLAGYRLVGAVAALVLIGIGVAATVQAIPEPPAEVTLVLEDYTVDATGNCSGAGELSQIDEGSEVLVLELPETSGRPREMASIVLPAGVERAEGCVFDLGNPLGTTLAGYVDIEFHPVSDPNAAMSGRFEGHRMIVTYFGQEH